MALAGDFILVRLDDSGGTLRDFGNGDITSVDLGTTYEQYDVTGFGDTVHKVINGQLKAPITLKGYLTTPAVTATPPGTHSVIQGAFAAKTQVTLEVRVGQNATPTTGDPKFSGEFFITEYKPSIAQGGALTFTATLVPATGIAPVWGVV